MRPAAVGQPSFLSIELEVGVRWAHADSSSLALLELETLEKDVPPETSRGLLAPSRKLVKCTCSCTTSRSRVQRPPGRLLTHE